MTQYERVREIRKSLKMTMEAFGNKVGVQKSAISKIEKGEVNLTDQMAKSICREFNVNYEWLINGDGEMFSNLPQTVLDELCRQYDLDDFDKSLVEMYISFPEPLRRHLKETLREMVKESKDNVPGSTGAPEPTVEELEEEYKKSVLNNAQKADKSTASNTTDNGKNKKTVR